MATIPIGIDLVAMSRERTWSCKGAEPLFFLDYYACGKLEPEIGAAIVAGISIGCREAGCALIGVGETSGNAWRVSRRRLRLAGFAVGAVERDAVLPAQRHCGRRHYYRTCLLWRAFEWLLAVRKVVEKTGLPLDRTSTVYAQTKSWQRDPCANPDI